MLAAVGYAIGPLLVQKHLAGVDSLGIAAASVVAGAARAAVVTYVNPAVALLLGVFLLDEHFGAGPAVGLALILLGSWLATRGSKSSH